MKHVHRFIEIGGQDSMARDKVNSSKDWPKQIRSLSGITKLVAQRRPEQESMEV